MDAAKTADAKSARTRPNGRSWSRLSPSFRVTAEGIEPLVLHRFLQKTTAGLMKKSIRRRKGRSVKQRRKRKIRPPRNFEADYIAATYRASEEEGGWAGFRAAIFAGRSLARVAQRAICNDFDETRDLITPQGRDYIEPDIPLVRLTEPRMHVGPARNWGSAKRSIFARVHVGRVWCRSISSSTSTRSAQKSLLNLVTRAGKYIGIGEGRPDSRMSNGCDWERYRGTPSTSRRSRRPQIFCRHNQRGWTK